MSNDYERGIEEERRRERYGHSVLFELTGYAIRAAWWLLTVAAPSS